MTTAGWGRHDLDRLCPDWTERDTYLSGPSDMLDAFTEHWERRGDCAALHMERFQPKLGLGDGAGGEGGTIAFLGVRLRDGIRRHDADSVAGEQAGIELPYGCREGICHTCVGELRSGRVRDLRNGEVYGLEGEVIRTCISAPEGPIEIDL